MSDLRTPDNPLENEYLELRLLQIDAQIKAKEIRIKELEMQIKKEQSEIINLNKEKDEVNKKLNKEEVK